MRSAAAKPQPEKKDDDQYEMAIRFKKDEDFSGWYQEVSFCEFRKFQDFQDFKRDSEIGN